MDGRTYRIAQWGLGNVGTHSLGAIIDHPRFELVALTVYSDSKSGRDAGDLCGRARTGILATQDADTVIAARPDCVLYMPHEADIDMMCRLLEAGINIATPCLGFFHRGSLAPSDREKLEAACQRGKSSLHSTGSAPGWSTETMPLALLAMQRRLDCLTITDYADMTTRDSPEMIFDLLRFGWKVEDLPPACPNGTAVSTPPSFTMMGEALGLPLERIETSIEYGLTTKRVTIDAGTLEAGTIGAMRMGIMGIHGGKPIIRRYSTWYCTRDIDQPWDIRQSGFRFQVEGDTPLDVAVAFVAENDVAYKKISPGFTAHPLINAVPAICAAPPGISHGSEMPIPLPYFGG